MEGKHRSVVAKHHQQFLSKYLAKISRVLLELPNLLACLSPLQSDLL